MTTTIPRTEIESVDCDERARTAMMAATKRVGGPYGAIADQLAETLRNLCALRMRGLDAADFGHIALCVSGVIKDLSEPDTKDIPHILRTRSMKDRADDRMTDLRAIDGKHVISNREMAESYFEAGAWNYAAGLVYLTMDRDERRLAAHDITRLKQTRSA